MEVVDLLKMSGFSAGTITALFLIYKFLKSMRGKKFVSSCCGRKLDVGFDVRNMESQTPTTLSLPALNEVKIEMKNNPMIVDGNQLQPRE